MQIQNILKPLQNLFVRIWQLFVKWWQKNWLAKAIIVVLVVLLVSLASLYGVARWYIATNADKPLQLGVSFIPDYARSLGLDANETMDALISDMGVKRFRLVSYWNKHEPKQGTYDFSDLDWQFKKAERAHAQVTLAIGLRQPRWPECHMPDWAKSQPTSVWSAELEKYIGIVIDRYKHSPSLVSYQLENEFFNDFGECPNHNRDRLEQEFAVAKHHDLAHPIIVSRSNNLPMLALGKPRPDVVGVSVYRRVWDAKITKQYYTYPLPDWYYAGIAGLQKIFTGKDSVIHELQMEAWPPRGEFIANISIAEQNKSMDANMFDDRVVFAKNTGMRSVDLWGAEWWYWRLVKAHDPSIWNEAQKTFENTSSPSH